MIHQITHGDASTEVGAVRINEDGTRIVFASNGDPTGRNPDRSFEIFLAECAPPPGELLTTDGRFEVEVSWRTADGRRGGGVPVRLTPDSGYYWFRGPDNGEVVVKVLDACAEFDRFWVSPPGSPMSKSSSASPTPRRTKCGPTPTRWAASSSRCWTRMPSPPAG